MENEALCKQAEAIFAALTGRQYGNPEEEKLDERRLLAHILPIADIDDPIEPANLYGDIIDPVLVYDRSQTYPKN